MAGGPDRPSGAAGRGIGPARLLRRLALAGIVVFLLISALAIHRWRHDSWRAFDQGFADLANAVFGQAYQPWWLFVFALPIVAVNLACMVQIARGRTAGILGPFAASAKLIAILPLFALQMVGYAMIWETMLAMAGFAIGGAIGTILYLGLDSEAGMATSPGTRKANEDGPQV